MGKPKCCNKECGLLTSGIVGGILIIFGAILVAVFEIIFNNVLIQEMTIKEGTLMYETWEEVYTPTFLTYFLYNVTNREEFLSQKKGEYIKPLLQEIGPYAFREYLAKDNIEFLENTDPEQVKFRQTLSLIFDEELSVGKLSDKITTLNVIAAAVAEIAEYQLRESDEEILLGLLKLFDYFYNDTQTELLFTKSIHDLLFGFEDDLYTKVVEMFGELNVTLPPTFGLFATMNNSNGWFEYKAYTGNGHPELINILTSFKGMTELDYWGDDYCNMINGTDGTTAPPFMNKEDKVYFFIDDVCRSLYGRYVEDVIVKNIPAWKYTIPQEIFQAPEKNPENTCFCADLDNILCKHDGAISLKSCLAGAPVLISLPHFLNGDGFYLNMTDGISDPDPEQHEVSLNYEPNTGQVIKVDKRLQINFELKNNPHINVLNQIEETIVFPILWLNESALIIDSDAELMYGLIVASNEAVYLIQIIFCLVGSIAFLLPVTIAVMSYCEKKDSKNLDVEEMQKYNSNDNDANESYADLSHKRKKSSLDSIHKEEKL